MKAKREFYCSTCDPQGGKPAMGIEQFKDHLKSIHKLESLKGTKRGIQFLDGSNFYSNTYELTFADPCGSEIKATEISSGPRSKHDLMASYPP